jgi:hypothetical protein
MSESKSISERRTAAHDIGVGGLVAGVVGGIVFAFLLVAVHVARGLSGWVAFKIAAYPFLGDQVLRPGFAAGPIALGVLSHFLVASIWGWLFALIFYRFSRPATVLIGALWGVIVWLGMFVGVLPLVAPKLAEGGGAFGNLIGHVIFGLAVGIGFLPFQCPDPQTGSSWHLRREAIHAAH